MNPRGMKTDRSWPLKDKLADYIAERVTDTWVTYLLISELHLRAWEAWLCCGFSFSMWSGPGVKNLVFFISTSILTINFHYLRTWVGLHVLQPKGNLAAELHMDKAGISLWGADEWLKKNMCWPKNSSRLWPLCVKLELYILL